MASAGDGAGTYQGGGAGGKFRKRPIRRSAQTTPYDRPPIGLRNNNPSIFSKLVDPASRLIYAGADRLFGVFRKRLPSLPAQRPPETNEEPRNGLQEAGLNDCIGVPEPSTDQGGNLVSVSAVTEISELEHMLKQKTFTRSEIKRLTALLHSRTNESPSDDVDGGDESKLPSTTSDYLRLEASTCGLVNKHVERENIHSVISTPVINSRVLKEDVASPAELAKAYMGTRPAKVSPSTLWLGNQAQRQDSLLLNNTTVIPKTPITSLAPKTSGSFRGFENGFTTPRSRGRSAIYSMARTPYYRGPSTFNQKGINSDYNHGVAAPSLEHEEPFGSSNMALKRRSSVLDDDIGSGGPLRRIRQKAYFPSQGSSLSKHRRESGSCDFAASQKLLIRNEPEPKVFKAVEENGETSMRSSGYFVSVPTKSTQMASKILEQLERLSPKEKSSGSRLAGMSEKSPTTQISNIIHGQDLRSVEKVDSPKFLSSPQDSQKSESQHDASKSTSQSKDKADENGPRKFAIPLNLLSSMNGSSTVPARDNALIVTNTDSTLKLPVEPPQKKRAFQMSAHEDYLEVDDDNHSNGHVPIPLVENRKPETSMVVNKDIPAEAPAKVIQTTAMPEVCKTSLPEVTKVPEMPKFSLPEVAKIPEMPTFKKPDDATISPPRTVLGPSGSSDLDPQKIGFNFTSSPPSTNTTQSAPQKEQKALPMFGTSTKNDEFLLSAKEPSGCKPNASQDAKPLSSSSLFNSVTKNDQVQFSVSNKDDNGNINGQKSVNMFGKSESLSSDGPSTTSTSSSMPAPFPLSSLSQSSGTNTNKLFNSNSPHVTSSAFFTTATTSFATGSVFSTPAPTPVFSFGSAIASSSASVTNATKAKEPPKFDNSSSPFASTGSSVFGFSSPAATSTSTTVNQSQGSLFSGSQVAPFQLGSSAPSLVSGASNPFCSSASTFSFGLGSAVASSEAKSGSSTSGSTTNTLGSSLNATPGFGLGSSTSAFGSSSTPFTFGASSTPSSSPVVFGSSASTGACVFSFTANSSLAAPPTPNNNDQMSMEDSMAEDSVQTANPAGGGGFMFGSGSVTQTVPFQFSQANPFQASSSVEFNGGGSFSLGSGDKAGRKFVRAKGKNRRK